jgi:hypothetical protein
MGKRVVHRLGDGRHTLPLWQIDGHGPRRVDSAGCILLLFICWADQRDYDAAEIFARASPDAPMLRADLLQFFRPWVVVPDRIETPLLCRDLASIGEDRLVRLLRLIDAGHWQPSEAFTHWVVAEDGRLAGEARALDPADGPDAYGQHFCFVRLFSMPEMAEWGYIDAIRLRVKAACYSE